MVLAEAQSMPAAHSADLLLRQGLALAQEGRLDDAERILLLGRQRFSSDKRFPQELAGVAYRRNNIVAAKAYLHEALRRDPADPYGNDFLGTLYILDGNLPAALKYWNRINKPLLNSVQLEPPPPLDPMLRERAFSVSAGQVFTLQRLQRTEANLDLLGVFTDCQFDLRPGPEPRFDLTIRPTPMQPLRGWPAHVLPVVRELPYQAVHLDFYNLRQRAIHFTSLWRWDREKRRIALDFSGLVRMWRYRLLLDARDESWDLRNTYRGLQGGLNGLVLRKAESGADLARNLTERLRWTTGVRAAVRQFHNGDGSPFFSNGWSVEAQNRLDYLLVFWPDERLRIDAWAILRTGRMITGFSSRLISAEGALKTQWLPAPKGEKYLAIAEFRTGGTFGNVPLDELFILGMERDNDLWLRGHVATRAGRKGGAPMGRRYLLTRTEIDRSLFRLPLARLRAGPFLDMGWTGDPSGWFGSRAWLCDTGVQAKIGTIGAVKFLAVYGRNLRHGGSVFYTAVSRQ
jgi:tetratricopeptide (TPR) repeat protein